jgi:hypothetical protein
MIKELYLYLTTKASKEARAFGHLYESIAIAEREKRCQTFWLPHRTQCKQFIETSLLLAKSRKKILILGSGPLHEIPLEKIAAVFTQVDLVDVVHMDETKKNYNHLKNVSFIEADVTELEKTILREKNIQNHIPTLFQNDHYDLVISANLLSQLSIHLREFLEKNARPKISEEKLTQFASQVTFDHYQYLLHFSCPVILITDVEVVFMDSKDQILEVESPYKDFSLPPPLASWWWNLAPIPEYAKDIGIKMKVAAFVLNI